MKLTELKVIVIGIRLPKLCHNLLSFLSLLTREGQHTITCHGSFTGEAGSPALVAIAFFPDPAQNQCWAPEKAEKRYCKPWLA